MEHCILFKKHHPLGIALLLMLVAAGCLLLSGCADKGTFEYYSENTKCFDKMEKKHPELEVKVDKNSIIYNYDITKLCTGMENDTSYMKKLTDTCATRLAAADQMYSDSCRIYETESGVNGIELTVNYTYNGKILVGRTYTSAGAGKGGSKVSDEASGKTEKEDK